MAHAFMTMERPVVDNKRSNNGKLGESLRSWGLCLDLNYPPNSGVGDPHSNFRQKQEQGPCRLDLLHLSFEKVGRPELQQHQPQVELISEDPVSHGCHNFLSAMHASVNVQEPVTDTYHGDKDPRRISSWISNMESYLSNLRIQGQFCMGYVSRFLRDDAAIWWELHQDEIRATSVNTHITDWAVFKEALKARFYPRVWIFGQESSWMMSNM